MKEVKNIVQINKNIAYKLHDKYGVPFGENGISVSGTRRKYYLCESKRNLEYLSKINTEKYGK